MKLVQLTAARIFYASIFELIGDGAVISIDIDQSRAEKTLRDHPLSSRVTLIKGDSGTPVIGTESKVHVFLESDHSSDHVLRELENLSGFVTPEHYVVVFDTILAEAQEWRERNPLVAIQRFLANNPDFVTDRSWEKYRVTSSGTNSLDE